MDANEIVTAIGTSNIALIKYWGKRDEHRILPTNSSISITLDENLSARTSVLFSELIKNDTFYLNGIKQDLEERETKEKFQVLGRMRALSGVEKGALVVSENNFPTAAGLASSAAGMATLVYACSKALGMNLSEKELSIIVRTGSGSACRSVIGGFVKWRKGESENGEDSYAEQILPASHWPDIIDLIAVVSEKKKKVSSRAGMKQTMQTSTLYRSRPEFAEGLAVQMEKALHGRDFKGLAEMIMRDSNNMHATMLDTWPPIMYLNDVSKEIIYAIHELNEANSEPVGAYTFDAGPNAHIITLKRNKDEIIRRLKEIEGVERLIESGIGNGPRILDSKDALIDLDSLGPKEKG